MNGMRMALKPSSTTRSRRAGSSSGMKGGACLAAEVDPAEQDDAAVRADEVPPLDAEHGRAAVWRPGRGCGMGRGDGFATRKAAIRHAAQASRNRAETRPRAARHRPASSRMGIGEGRSI